MMKVTKSILLVIESYRSRSGKVRRLCKDSRQFYSPDYYDPKRRVEIGDMNAKATRCLYLDSVTFPHSY